MRRQSERGASPRGARHRSAVAFTIPAALSVLLLAACASAGPPPAAERATVKEPASSSNSDEMLMCRGTPVPAQALTTPRPATELPAEVVAVLEDPLVGIEEPLSEWLIAHESAELVTVMHELEEPLDMGAGDISSYALITIGAGAEQALPLEAPWGLQRSTNCTPTIDLGSFTEAGVTLDPDAPPQSGDERIALLVSEHDCNSGQPATGRIELIELVETATTVELVIGVRPNTGGIRTCQSNPPTPFTVDLEQPLAERMILNAAVAPAREVTWP